MVIPGGIVPRDLPPIDYKYLVTDLKTRKVVGVLPFSAVEYGHELSGAGSFSADLKINKETNAFAVREITKPGKAGLYVVRKGVPVWGGIIWKRVYSGRSRTLDIQAETFESYFYKRFNRITKRWTNTDQFSIALELTSPAGISVDMTIHSGSSGKRRDREVYGHEFKTIGDELERLGNLIDGFDWNVDIGLDSNGDFTRTLRFYYPEKGISKAQTSLSFEYPGSISDFEFSEDAEAGANRMWAIGAGDAEEQIVAVHTETDGYPLIEESRSYKSVSRMTTLTDHVKSDFTRLQSPVEIVKVDVRADLDPVLGAYSVGDWARFSFSDDYFTPPYTLFMRIISYVVTVNNNGLESVSLTANTERQELEPGDEEDD